MTRIGIISDTHGYLDEKVFKHFTDCDEIWHAGDIGNINITDQLIKFKNLRAVYGNIDGIKARAQFNENELFDIEKCKIFLTHIGGKPYVYNERVKNIIMEHKPQILVCGHSHILRVEYDKKYKLLYINPGAAGKHGFHHVRTIIKFSIDGLLPKDMQVIELGKRA